MIHGRQLAPMTMDSIDPGDWQLGIFGMGLTTEFMAKKGTCSPVHNGIVLPDRMRVVLFVSFCLIKLLR